MKETREELDVLISSLEYYTDTQYSINEDKGIQIFKNNKIAFVCDSLQEATAWVREALYITGGGL